MRVGTGELIAAHRALAAVEPASLAEARLALRAILCAGRADLAAFEAAFAHWSGQRAREVARPQIDPVTTAVLPSLAIPVGGTRPARDDGTGLQPAAWSAVELLRDKDFAEYTDAERALAREIMARIAAHGPHRRSRRTRASRRRRLVLVCDISGSMEPYSRMLLQYAHACVRARRRCEAFAFGTRLTRITADLRGRDPDLALSRAADAVADWSGGTRIGDAVAELNRAHGRRLGRGAVIVILSDGWDRGDPELLGREIAWLARCAHRLVWLNPLKASRDYEPLTRGMVAALPHVDDFLAGNTLASLEELAARMESGFDERPRGASRLPQDRETGEKR